MNKLTLDLDTLRVQTFATDASAAAAQAPAIATANTCYRTCYHTCLC